MCACSPRQHVSVRRIAILPANILVADPAAQWLSLAVPIVLSEDLATSRQYAPALAASEPAAYQLGATALLRTTVEYRQGHLTAKAILTDVASQKTESVLNLEPTFAPGLIASLNQLARQIDPQASPFPAKNDRALAFYAQALVTGKPETRLQLLNNAVTADPNFGLAYLSLIETLAQNGGGQNIAPVLGKAATHRDAFTPLDRARFDGLTKRFSRVPPQEQAKALEAILAIAPNDVPTLAALGSQRYLAGASPDGERLIRQAVQLDPNNFNIRRQLADGLMLSGKSDDAIRLIADFAAQYPNEVQARQALGETQFTGGRFKDAEQTLTGLGDNPASLTELATCILMQNDPVRANIVFERNLGIRQNANDPFVSIGRAVWMSISGQKQKAIDYLLSNSFPQADLRSLAITQVALWQVTGVNNEKARKSAAQAATLAKAPIAKVLSAGAQLVASGDAPADQFRAAVQAAAIEPGTKQLVLGYGFFLNARYPEAAGIWQALVQQSNGTDLRARVMLTASLAHAGKSPAAFKSAAPLFFPNLTGGDQYAFITFAEMLRAKQAEATVNGDANTAAHYAKLVQLVTR